ncbi:MAG TPA: helix-turn-helix domain-containing protein [Nitrososphaerales archaeon]
MATSVKRRASDDVRTVRPVLGTLTRKWALTIMADIGFRKINRFNRLLKSNPGLTPRMLSKRLRDLQKDGLIEKAGLGRWKTTHRGSDMLPAVMDLIAYGARWNDGYQPKGTLPKVLVESNSQAGE